jgi:hypothetical protein
VDDDAANVCKLLRQQAAIASFIDIANALSDDLVATNDALVFPQCGAAVAVAP